jgi:hypothetical protein
VKLRTCPDWLPSLQIWEFLKSVSTQELPAESMRHYYKSAHWLLHEGLIETVNRIYRPTERGREALRLWADLESVLTSRADTSGQREGEQ